MNSIFTKKIVSAFQTRRLGVLLLSVCLSILSVSFPQMLSAQTPKEITGQVFDEKGAPIIGVNIYNKDRTSIGTSTDKDGRYTLKNITPGTNLVFSMVGFQSQTISVGAKTVIDVTLIEDLATIDAVTVVATGYGGEVNKRNTTAATASIKMDEIADIPVFKLGEALVGMVPGLDVSIGSQRPGAESVDWGIRRSYRPGDVGAKDAGDANPLVVIDDIRTTVSALDNLDPNLVESIDILKDAAAAIYGSEGSQGVIIVKTKRGKSGKPSISYSANIGISDKMNKFPEMMNSYEYGQFWNSVNRANYNTNTEHYFSDEELERMKGIDYNWLDKAWKAGVTSRHSVSIGGGTDKVSYNAGVGYLTKSENLGDFDDNNKWSYNAGVNAILAKGLRFDLQLSGGTSAISKQNAKNGNDFPVLARMPRYIPWEVYDQEGNAQFVARAMNPGFMQKLTDDYTTRDLAGNNFFAMQNAGNRTENDNFNFGVNASIAYEVPFIPGLTIRGSYNRSDNSSRGMEFRQKYSLYCPINSNVQGTHLYTDMGVENGSLYRETVYSKDNMVQYTFDKGFSWGTKLYLTYARTFGKHQIDALYTFDKSASEARGTQLRYENALGIFGGTSATSGDLIGENTVVNRSESGDMAYLARINYGFNNRYFFTFVGRYDAHTKFSPENYWGFFPSVAGAWIISDEKFFKNVKGVNFLKLRLSWGKSGQKNVKDWEWMQRYGLRPNESGLFGTNPTVGKGTGLKMDKSPNRNATWSDSYQYNVGLDMRFLRDRLGVTLDQWRKEDRNILTNRVSNLPISIGGTVAAENYGGVNSWGTEISVNWSDRVSKDFRYNISANWSTYNNKLIHYERNMNSAVYPWTQVQGRSSYFGEWGYKVWRGTSSGDGMIRTVEDAEKYWAYLEANAQRYTEETGKASSVNFFGITKKEDFVKKLGMLVYEDVTGPIVQDPNTKEWSYERPDGRLRDNEDQIELAKARAQQTINTRFSVTWKNLTFSTALRTSWGGWNAIDYGSLQQDLGNNKFTENTYRFMTDMYDMEYNQTGRYPNVNHRSYNSKMSDFWAANSFSLMIQNMTLSYQVPREFANKIGLQGVRFSFSGSNIGYLVDPMRKYGTATGNSLKMDYPLLRTWAIAINITFK